MPAGEPVPPVLDVPPPHWAGRLLASVLILVAGAVAVASVAIEIPETVTASFVLVPRHGTDPVRASRSGVVGSVRVTEGKRVLKDEVLLVLQSVAVGDRSAELRSLEAQLAGAGQSLVNTRSKSGSQRRADDEETEKLRHRLGHLRQRIAEQENLRGLRERRFREALGIAENEIEIASKEIEFKTSHHRVAKELAGRSQTLHAQGMVSWLEFTTRQLEANKLATDLDQLGRQLDSSRRKASQVRAEHERESLEAALALSQLESERQETASAIERLRHESRGRDADAREVERRLVEDLEKARIRVAALGDELGQSRGSQLVVGSPCSGTVVRLGVKAPGAVVQTGDLAADVACDGGTLQAEVTVPQAGLGRIQPTQSVKLLYDAFPYQRFGVRWGTVRWVSPAAVPDRDGAAFRALVDLADQWIVVHREPEPLRAGLRGRALVVVGRRSLVSFAVEPLRELRESLRHTQGP